MSLIGRLVVDLPAPDVALVHIQATFAAIADFGIPELRIVASLTGSYIVGLTLTGDLFVLIRGGSDSAFVLSAGGFHPDVRPPAGVPPLQRIGAAMGFGFGEIRYESYFAVTTTSVQFGAKAELHAEVADCGIHGWFGFDALIEWLPRFHFSVGITAGVEVEVFGETLLGIRLQGSLEGPSPWHVKARGEVEVLLVSVTISIDESFGDSPAPLTFVPDVGVELLTAVSDPGSWTLHPPSADTDGVVLSAAAAAAVAKGTLLHPAGSLQVRQRLLPFGVTIDRFGGYGVPAQRWVLTGVRLRAGADPVPPQVIDRPVRARHVPHDEPRRAAGHNGIQSAAVRRDHHRRRGHHRGGPQHRSGLGDRRRRPRPEPHQAAAGSRRARPGASERAARPRCRAVRPELRPGARHRRGRSSRR